MFERCPDLKQSTSYVWAIIMSRDNLVQQDIARLRESLSRQMIPRVSSQNLLRMVVAERPLRLPLGITVKRRPAPLLKINRDNRSDLFLGKCPEERMHAIRYPYLCYITEGEMDVRLGVPAENGEHRGVVTHYEVLSMPAHSALLIPPGVFFPEGGEPYWERDTPAPDTSVFWTHILPTGVFCHISSTRNGIHQTENLDVFVPGQQFSALIDIYREELSLADSESFAVAQSALQLFFSRLFRGLREASRSTIISRQQLAMPSDSPSDNHSIILSRACEFIRKNNNSSFTVEDVADYAYVSPSHLMRLFRSELQTTVMEYALSQRISYAEAWLKSSEMPIKQIANTLGYKQSPQFIRAFKRVHGLSPTEFRRQHRR